MISTIYALVVVVLFWVPLGIFLHGFYSTKYDDPQEAQSKLDRDMKAWAPVLVLILVILIPKTKLLVLIGIGIMFEGYTIYSEEEEGAITKFKRYLSRSDNND